MECDPNEYKIIPNLNDTRWSMNTPHWSKYFYHHFDQMANMIYVTI
jgi:hypothetical protein